MTRTNTNPRALRRRRRRAAAVLCGVLVAIVCAASAAPAACSHIDQEHAAWTNLLRRFVRDGRVAYADWLREGRAPLQDYLHTLSGACAADYAAWSRDERIAFWLNAYNAFTIELILDHYPIASIRDIGWLPGAAFRKDFIPMPGLKGGTISLNDIEHGTLRADFHEPRIHFALVCASRACPPLRDEAYRAAVLDSQLDDQARTFLRDQRVNRFDPKKKVLYLSRIFDWFGDDFVAAAGSVRAYAARYIGDPRAAADDVHVQFLDYDWRLNDRGE